MNEFPILFAQAEDANPVPSTESPSPASVQIPHGQFLFDYVLVLVLLAAALYAVCRSSRRV